MAAGCVFIGGEYVPPEDAKISIFDPGFTRGDAVYDTVTVWGGRFFRLDDHVDRFFRSCERGRLTCPHSKDEVKRIFAQCVHRAGLDAAYVQAIVTRGPFPSITQRDPRLCENRFIAYAVPYIWLIPLERHEPGIDLAIAAKHRTPPEAVDPRMKNFGWLDMQHGLFEALDNGADTCVLLSPSGLLTEGPGFNVFAVSNGVARTPRSGVLEGITRTTVFPLAEEAGIEAVEADLRADALTGADEAFISSSAGGIIPVVSVNGVRLAGTADGPGPVSRALRTLYWEKREAGWLGTPVAELL